MAIKSNRGPLNGFQVMQRELVARMPQAKIFSSPLGGAPQAGSPVPVYHLPLDRLHDPDPIAAATLTGWRYPVAGAADVGLADIRENPLDGSTRFGGLSFGLLVERFIEASAMAEKMLAAASEEFEPRILDVPALRFAALWLRGPDTEHFVSLLEGRPPGTAPLTLVSSIIGELQARASVQAKRMLPTGGGAPGTPTN
jgi:hypothetical protein